MWAGYEEALARYGLDICAVWCATGRADTCATTLTADLAAACGTTAVRTPNGVALAGDLRRGWCVDRPQPPFVAGAQGSRVLPAVVPRRAGGPAVRVAGLGPLGALPPERGRHSSGSGSRRIGLKRSRAGAVTSGCRRAAGTAPPRSRRPCGRWPARRRCPARCRPTCRSSRGGGRGRPAPSTSSVATPCRRAAGATAELVQEHLGALVRVRRLDPGDHPDGAAVAGVRDQQVVGGVGEESVGLLRQRRRVEEIGGPVHGRSIHHPLDPHRATLVRRGVTDRRYQV